MRDIVVSMWITLDGFVAGPDDAMDWLLGDDELMAYEQSFVDNADTLLLGRKTFNDFAGYWPGVAGQVDPDDEPPDSSDALQRRYARRVDAVDKVVVSASGKTADWGKPQILSTVDEAEIRRLKEGPGKSIVMYGSLSVIGELSRLGMIDEYHLLVHPIFLGQGTPMFDQANPVKLQLKSAEPLGSGVVVMKYVPGEKS